MTFDAYISYNRRDREFAEKLARFLSSRSFSVWFDLWQLKGGDRFSDELAKGLLESRAVIIIVGSSGIGPWQKEEIYAALSRKNQVILPVVTPDGSIEGIPFLLRQYQFLYLRDQEEEALTPLVSVLAEYRQPIQPSTRPPRVFLCHAKEDAQRIKQVYFSFRDRGLDPWYDKEKLLLGDDWEQEIIQAIEQSDFFAIFLSKVSSTKTGFIQKEIRTAIKEYQKRPQGNTYLLPIRLEDCIVPHILLDANRKLPDLQWADLFENDENAIDGLCTAILKQWEKKLRQ